MRESSSLCPRIRTVVLWVYRSCVSSLVYLLSPEFLSAGLFTRGDIPQYQSVSDSIFSSLQLFLLETTRVSLTTKLHLEQSDADSLHLEQEIQRRA
ncbi:hypothetical protein BDR05DRAFT_971704, partial [Suillus weaverae]